MPGTTVLDMPFDESTNSPIAHDYSPGAHHADVTDGTFVPGKFGNCLYFPSGGKAEIIPMIWDLAQDWTYMIWIVTHGYGYNPYESFLVYKFPGVDNEIVINLASDFSRWTHIAITKQGNILRVYKGGVLFSAIEQPGLTITGFRIVNTLPHVTGGHASFDDAKIIQGEAITPEEIVEIIGQNQIIQPVNFSLNNVLLTNYGIYVDGISGAFGRPKKKDGLKADWADEHGLIRPVNAVDIYEEKSITLSCWIEAPSLDDFFSNWHAFVGAISAPGTHRLQLDAGSKKVVAEVVLENEIDIDKDDFIPGQQFARFKLNLNEPQPVKRVLKAVGTSASITYNSSHKMTIYWGDGSRTVNAGSGTHTHAYAGAGDYYIIVAGRIDKLTDWSTDAIVHFNLLV